MLLKFWPPSFSLPRSSYLLHFHGNHFDVHPVLKFIFLRSGAWGSSPLRCQLQVCDDFQISTYDHHVTMESAVQGRSGDSSHTGGWILSQEINIHTRYSLSQGFLEKIMSCSLPDPKFCILGSGCWRVTSPYCSLVPQDSCFCKYGTSHKHILLTETEIYFFHLHFQSKNVVYMKRIFICFVLQTVMNVYSILYVLCMQTEANGGTGKSMFVLSF